MSPEWSTIVYHKLQWIENYPLARERERGTLEKLQRLFRKVHRHMPCWPARLVRYRSGPLGLEPFDLQSGQQVKSLKKTEERHKKTWATKRKLEPPQAPHRMLLSPVDAAHDPVFPVLDSSVMSVPADDVGRLPNMLSRSQAMMMIFVYVYKYHLVVVVFH